MKKRLLPLALTLCMLLSLLPATAMAAETGNFSDNHVTWIGTQAEYQKTIDNMYVNGMRKMKVADKWGILDATGEWVAAPIYDSIQLEYLVARDSGTGVPLTKSSEPLEVLFRGGYTQCVRGGKMGLMNQYGEEAIPPQYDAVGLPSEGICRIVKKTDSGAYLGYWSLELGRELVAPSKYPVSGGAATAAGQPVVHQMLDKNAAMSGTGGSSNQADGSSTIDYEEVALPNGDRLAAQHDYMGGYAFVTTGAGPQGCLYGSILDKSGKEILPGGPYLYRAGLYPQFGPYMVYCKQSDQPYLARGESLGNPYLSGVVGPQGVIIPAQYSGGIRAPITGWYVGDARMTVIPELQLVITAKDTTPGKENGGKVGVVNFKNQTLIPFTHDFNYFTYKAQPKIFAGLTPEGDRMYTLEGKRLNESSYLEIGPFGNYAMCNGFAQVIKPMETPPNGNYPAGNAKCFVNLKTGAEIFPEAPAAAHSNFSTNGLAWMMNPQKKWGLMDSTGKMVLPYQYDAVVADAWCREKNGYAIVTSGQQQGIVTAAGAELVPCQYDNIAILSTHGPVDKEFAEVTKDGKTGLLSAITGKLVIPCSYASIGSREAYLYQRDYFSLGATLVRTGENDYCLVDRDGNKVPGSDYPHVDSPNRGLFHTHKNGYIGVEGKVIFPDTLSYSGRKNMVTDDSALVVQGGKVGYLAAEKLARPTQPKALNPATAAAAVSPTKLLVDGKAVAA
ncbi:MAG: WG repeat-containing protein, partial [Pseudoflavonifractor sp.]